MSTDEVYPFGYHRVDESSDPALLLANMVANAGWDATIDLRAWERDRLRLAPGEWLLMSAAVWATPLARWRRTSDRLAGLSAWTPAPRCSTRLERGGRLVPCTLRRR